jgi:glutamate racemase
VLGCTHYPFASEHLQVLVGANVTLVENGAAVGRQAQRLLDLAPFGKDAAVRALGRIRLFRTSDARPLQAAAAYWLALREQADLLHI